MCWHKWSKWMETARGELLKYPDIKDLSKNVHVGQVSYQERVCLRCNRKELYCAVARISPDYAVQRQAVGIDEACVEVASKNA